MTTKLKFMAPIQVNQLLKLSHFMIVPSPRKSPSRRQFQRNLLQPALETQLSSAVAYTQELLAVPHEVCGCNGSPQLL
jgi:hypothetical protein